MSPLSDRAPPELEPGVTLDDLTTIEACDAALDRLTMAIPSIEEQIARHRSSPNQPPDWRPRAEKALRVKKLLLPRLQQRRADLARADKAARHVATKQAGHSQVEQKRRVMIGVAWEVEPAAMQRVEAVARERRPDLFDDQAGGA